MSTPTLVIMAAGMGNRYGGLKQIDSLGPSGELLIDYAVYDALKAGFGKIVFIIRHRFEDEFRAEIGRAIEDRVETAYAFQELDRLPAGFAVPPDREKPWGTGHAVLCAAGEVDGNFAVINADDFYGAGAYGLLYDYLVTAGDNGGTYDYCMVGYTLKNTLSDHGYVSRGVCSVSDGTLREIVELKKVRKCDAGACFMDDQYHWKEVDPESTVSMNMFGYTPGIFDELGHRFESFLRLNLDDPDAEFYLPVVTSDLIAEGTAAIRVLPTDEKWLGITYPEDKPAAAEAIETLVAAGAYPRKLWD